jgi:L-2-hydroxycarboxylate dehydrogenase (NAD+)
VTERSGRTYGQWWDAEGPYVTVRLGALRDLGAGLYRAAGASDEDAAFLFDTNLDKATQGDHARGLGKVSGIIRSVRAGAFDLGAPIEVIREHGATAVVDGGKKAHGRLVCRRAMELAVAKARGHGIAIVGARASGELLTPFVKMAADAGMIGIAMVQSVPTVAPLGGFQPLLGNAPLAIAVPARGRDDVVLDMSFTQSSASGVLLAAAQGQQIPAGLLLDEHGRPTTDATDFPDDELVDRTGGIAVRGTLTPLGNSHKGYAMVFVVGLLASLLTDSSPPWDLDWNLPERGTYGTVLLAVDPNALNPNDPASRVDEYIDRVVSAPRLEGVDRILYPGERSQELKRLRRASDRIEIPRSHLDELEQLAAELHVPMPDLSVTPEPTGGDA